MSLLNDAGKGLGVTLRTLEGMGAEKGFKLEPVANIIGRPVHTAKSFNVLIKDEKVIFCDGRSVIELHHPDRETVPYSNITGCSH